MFILDSYYGNRKSQLINHVVAAVIRGHVRVCPLLILEDLKAYGVCSLPLLKKYDCFVGHCRSTIKHCENVSTCNEPLVFIIRES